MQFLAFLGFGWMSGSFLVYYALWAVPRENQFLRLLAGSSRNIAAIAAANQHMKLVFVGQSQKSHLTGGGSPRPVNEMFRTASLYINLTSNVGRICFGYFAGRFSKKRVMVVTYFLVPASIPLLLRVEPIGTPYVFILLFGLAMSASEGAFLSVKVAS